LASSIIIRWDLLSKYGNLTVSGRLILNLLHQYMLFYLSSLALFMANCSGRFDVNLELYFPQNGELWWREITLNASLSVS
jgi:hypothetical protein